MVGMRFAKGHGTQNDFVLLPDPDATLELTPALVRALCDRRAGIGADGVLRVVRSAKHPDSVAHAGDAEWFMDFHNADGTTGEMCGNGLRVFARYLTTERLVDARTFTVATRAGLRGVEINDDLITADALRPTLGVHTTAVVSGVSYDGITVDVGNPHLVCQVPDGETLDALDLSVAPTIDPAVLPAGANVEFVVSASESDAPRPVDQPSVDASVRMRVHERGAGETRSCGTGAVAVAGAALANIGQSDGTVAVAVPGGQLHIRLTGTSGLLTGPAEIVAEGSLNARWLASQPA